MLLPSKRLEKRGNQKQLKSGLYTIDRNLLKAEQFPISNGAGPVMAEDTPKKANSYKARKNF